MDRDFYFRFGRLTLRLLLHEPNDLLVLRKVDVRPRKAGQIRQSATRVVRGDNETLPIAFSGLYQFRDLLRQENVFKALSRSWMSRTVAHGFRVMIPSSIATLKA